jgi:hypothetical protein
VLIQFCGQNIGKYDCAFVLFKEFYFDTLKLHFETLKRLMEGKRFSADVKCKDQVRVQFDGPNEFVSNEHPYGDEFLERSLFYLC